MCPWSFVSLERESTQDVVYLRRIPDRACGDANYVVRNYADARAHIHLCPPLARQSITLAHSRWGQRRGGTRNGEWCSKHRRPSCTSRPPSNTFRARAQPSKTAFSWAIGTHKADAVHVMVP